MSLKEKMKNNRSVLFLFFWFYGTVLFYEIIFRIRAVPSFWGIGLCYILLFSIPIACLITAFCTVFPPKINRIFAFIFMAVLFLFYLSQIIYFGIFKTNYTFFSLLNGSQVTEFSNEIFTALLKNWFYILIFLLPPLFFYITNRKLSRYQRHIKIPLLFFALTIISSYFGIDCLSMAGTDLFSPYDLYFYTVSSSQSADKLGLAKTFQLDAKRLILGTATRPASSFETEASLLPESNPTDSKPNDSKQEEDIIYEDNVMDFDFETLINNETDEKIKSMHQYFQSVTPTKQNKYTGIYKGYNLIYITAEGFSSYAIDKTLTPTLYKMAHEGYQFTNFYNPIWGVSTLDGEYVNCLSLIPKEGVWSLYKSSDHYLPFALGNQFKNLNYPTWAFHDHTYNYYHRDLSHPNLGYTYQGVGNGLSMKQTWPESDVEMIDITTDTYTSSDPFHVYYLTVSGHLNYTFNGNAMATKNRDLVKDLPFSEECQAYLACNIELDRAMELLLARLEEAGIADQTVIAIGADHYPYGLENEQISEFLGHPVEENFELYKSTLILYTPDMEPQVINKPCSSLDMLPTVSNLFGLEYDSRLLMGQDIFSDADPLVMFVNRSWVTDKAMFNAATGEVTPTGNEPVSDEYAAAVNQKVSNKFDYSAKILDYDYYRILFGK